MRSIHTYLRLLATLVAALFSSLIMLGILRRPRDAKDAPAPPPAPPLWRSHATTPPSPQMPAPISPNAPPDNTPPPAPPPLRFNTALLALGLLFTLVIGVDLLVRGGHRFPPDNIWNVPGGDVARGRQAIIAHGCGGCHVIPGIRTATGRVGPQLRDFRQQMYIAGRLPNQWQNLVRWIQNPQHIDPGNAMPNLNVTEPEARDIAAYLYSVR